MTGTLADVEVCSDVCSCFRCRASDTKHKAFQPPCCEHFAVRMSLRLSLAQLVTRFSGWLRSALRRGAGSLHPVRFSASDAALAPRLVRGASIFSSCLAFETVGKGPTAANGAGSLASALRSVGPLATADRQRQLLVAIQLAQTLETPPGCNLQLARFPELLRLLSVSSGFFFPHLLSAQGSSRRRARGSPMSPRATATRVSSTEIAGTARWQPCRTTSWARWMLSRPPKWSLAPNPGRPGRGRPEQLVLQRLGVRFTCSCIRFGRASACQLACSPRPTRAFWPPGRARACPAAATGSAWSSTRTSAPWWR